MVPTAPANPSFKAVRRNGFSLLLTAGAIVVGGYALWRTYELESSQAQDGNTIAQVARLQTQLEITQRGIEQERHEAETLRGRLADHEAVNKSLREEVLGAVERTRMLEEAVANLADKRMTGHDALLLNEAELLLLMAEQRYRLFQDAGTAISAYRLAEQVLAELDDPAFTTVRQSVNAEIDALAALKTASTNAAIDELERLRAQLSELPKLTFVASKLGSQNHEDSRLWQVLGQFVRISHGEDSAGLLQTHDAALAETLIALDLREAQAALLVRDAVRYRKALVQARAAYAKRYDATATSVIAALAMLDHLIAEPPVASAPLLLGTSLKELRTLRTTHALRHDSTPAAKDTEPKP